MSPELSVLIVQFVFFDFKELNSLEFVSFQIIYSR